MKISTNLPKPKENHDPRPDECRRIGGVLRQSKEVWHDLDLDDLTAMLIEPDQRGLPGSDETHHLRSCLNNHNPTLRDGRSFHVRLVDGIHQAMYG